MLRHSCVCNSSPNSMEVIGTCDAQSVAWSLFRFGQITLHLGCTISKLTCPRRAMVSVFILIIASISSGLFSEWAFNSIYVVLAVILPTLVSAACKFDNFKSLPLAWRSSCTHISGFTFGVINWSQFAGRRYFPHLSLRFELSSLLSHLKFMIFASLSETLGSVFSVSDRDCAISSSKESSSSAPSLHAVLSLSLFAVFCC